MKILVKTNFFFLELIPDYRNSQIQRVTEKNCVGYCQLLKLSTKIVFDFSSWGALVYNILTSIQLIGHKKYNKCILKEFYPTGISKLETDAQWTSSTSRWKKILRKPSLSSHFAVILLHVSPTNQAAKNEYTKYDSANFALIIYLNKYCMKNNALIIMDVIIIWFHVCLPSSTRLAADGGYWNFKAFKAFKCASYLEYLKKWEKFCKIEHHACDKREKFEVGVKNLLENHHTRSTKDGWLGWDIIL